jgi:hypothetical protein
VVGAVLRAASFFAISFVHIQAVIPMIYFLTFANGYGNENYIYPSIQIEMEWKKWSGKSGTEDHIAGSA